MHLIPSVWSHRIKIISKFISVQLVVQFIGAISGFILIRILSKEDYAYLTIANSMQGIMSILADSGVSISLSVIGGKVWQDSYRFGQLINTVMRLRRWFALIASIIVTPIMVWMLISNHASITYTITIAIAVLVELNFYLEIAVFVTVPRLHSQITFIQNVDLVTTTSRLILLATAYLFYLNTAVAVWISTVVSGLQSFLLRKSISKKIDAHAEISSEDRKYTLKLVKNLFPNAIFYSIQGQLTLVLISFFGNTQNVAEIGALGRLSVLFSVINSIMCSIVLPSFARCNSLILLRKRYLQIILSFIGIGIIFLVITLIFPRQLLWILGNKYYNLEKELIWMVGVNIITNLGGITWSLCATKGWVEKAWIEIPIRIAIQTIALFIVDISTVRGVLFFSLISNFPPIIVNTWLASQGLLREEHLVTLDK